ncbi:FIST N-terminal domain-containing protein, partial [Robiginitalea sp.]|uniref:FIST N-terminal domain-containing protein n=1 Tax=Robiginitalea sp. TaxID=1902411 RepID=UPI003C4915DD
MKAKTIHGDSPEEIQAALHQIMDGNFLPTLAIVFISIKQDRKAVCSLFEREGIQVIGATSSGEFVEGHESKEGIVAMLLDLDPSSFRIILREIGDGSLKEAAGDLLGQAKEAFSNPSFILLSTFHSEKGTTVDGGSLIRYITEVAGPEVNLFGGMAGDDISFTGTFVFTDSRVTDYGIVALVLDEEKVRLRG